MAKSEKTQIQKFKEAARAIKADQSEKRFNQVLKGVAKAEPKPTKRKKS